MNKEELRDNQLLQALMYDIINRSDGGDLQKMSLCDRISFKLIFSDIKNQLDEFIRDFYPTIEYYADYDIDADIAAQKQPDMSKIRTMLSESKKEDKPAFTKLRLV